MKTFWPRVNVLANVSGLPRVRVRQAAVLILVSQGHHLQPEASRLRLVVQRQMRRVARVLRSQSGNIFD